MKEFSCKQKKKIQYNHSSLEMHYFAVFTKKGQDLSLLCCCKAWIAWFCWVWICWYCIMSWLWCHSRVFLSFFYSCKSSGLNPLWTKLSALFLSPVSFSSCSLRFHVSANLSIAFFFLFLELSFLFFLISDCLFWLSPFRYSPAW